MVPGGPVPCGPSGTLLGHHGFWFFSGWVGSIILSRFEEDVDPNAGQSGRTQTGAGIKVLILNMDEHERHDGETGQVI